MSRENNECYQEIMALTTLTGQKHAFNSIRDGDTTVSVEEYSVTSRILTQWKQEYRVSQRLKPTANANTTSFGWNENQSRSERTHI